MKQIIKITQSELDELIYTKQFLGSGAEGDVYRLNNKNAIKVFNGLNKEHNIEELLKHSNIKNNGYYFPQKVYLIDDSIVAYSSKFCKGYNLYKINPFSINLNDLIENYLLFKSDTKEISNQGIKGQDMCYNFMYDGNKFSAIDTESYIDCDENEDEIFKFNITNFNNELGLLLIDGNFEKFINNNKELKELYNNIINFKEIDFIYFVKKFKNELAKYCDSDIIYLKDAKKAVKHSQKNYYSNPVCSLKKR